MVVLVGSLGTTDSVIAVLTSRVVLFTVDDDCRVSILDIQVLLTAATELAMILLVFCWLPTAATPCLPLLVAGCYIMLLW